MQNECVVLILDYVIPFKPIQLQGLSKHVRFIALKSNK